jgi:hypothetical protein
MTVDGLTSKASPTRYARFLDAPRLFVGGLQARLLLGAPGPFTLRGKPC